MRYLCLSAILTATCYAGLLSLLGGVSFSDFSVVPADSELVDYDYEKTKTAFSLILQYQFPVTDLLDIGFELDGYSAAPFRWEWTESGEHPASYTRELREYSGSVFLSAGIDFEWISPFVKVAAGGYYNTSSLKTSYFGESPDVESRTDATLYPGVKLLGGFNVPLYEKMTVRVEGGRTFLPEESMGTQIISEIDRMNSWNLRVGLTHEVF
jgi:hypothetical protein